MKSLTNTHINVVLGHRWLTVLACLSVMLICAAGAGSITNSTDFRDLFAKDNPELLEYNKLNDTYAHASANVILIAVAPESGEIFSREALGVIEQLTELSWQLPYASRVDSLTNHFHSRSEEDDLFIEPLVENVEALTDSDLKDIEQIALDTTELKTAWCPKTGGSAA